jgi:hypothetical protein
MKLWLLRPVDNLPDDANPWEPWYDKAFGFVVRAETEEGARRLATEEAGDEKHGPRTTSDEDLDRTYYSRDVKPWEQPSYSTCVELTAEGEPGIIIQDFRSA